MDDIRESLRFLLEVSARLDSASEKGPAENRVAALALLGDWMAAESAQLVPAERGAPRLDLATRWGAALDLEADRKLLVQALAGDEPVLRTGPNGTSVLIPLACGGKKLGVLMLHGAELRFEPDNAAALRTASALLAAWEQNRRLERLLSVAERRLRVLTADSQAVAERNQRLFEQMIANQRRLDGVSKGFIRLQEEERSRISRELHDGVGQSLTAMKINLDLVAADLASKSPENAQTRLGETQKLARETLEDVRELSRLLRPRMLDELGLVPTLKWLARSFSQRTELAVEVFSPNPVGPLDSDLETLLFRVAQEGLNNAWKHARATRVQLRLGFASDRVSLEICDDGTGLVEAKSDPSAPGSGLPGIRERVALAGGKLQLESRPGLGTTLRVTIPLDSPAGGEENSTS